VALPGQYRWFRALPDEAPAFALEGEGEPVPAPPDARDGVLAPLTRREREMAELLARGLSNRRIAGTPVISGRAVEGHVDHILARLGCADRAQVAARIGERRHAPRR